MKSFILIVGISLCLVACNQSSVQNEEAALKRKDSLLSDSINRMKLMQAKEAENALKRKDSLLTDSLKKLKSANLRKEEHAMAHHSSRNYSNSSVGAYNNPPEAPAKPKGWSDAAKGTAIGAGGGAIAGALIDKRHGQGAIIGGLVGAGAGYLIGRGDDRKSGRVKPKPKPAPDPSN